MSNLIDNLVANWSEAARRARNDGYFERASGFDDCCADLRTHAAEIERNARDAERYRWLRENGERMIGDDRGAGPEWTYDDELDAAIDAAMREGGGE